MIQNRHLQELHSQGYEVYEHRWLTSDSFKSDLGFTPHSPKIYRKWMRTCSAAEEGTPLKVWNDTIYLHMGHYMIYDPSIDTDSPVTSPEQLSHWPVDPVEYAQTYAPFPMQIFPYQLISEEEGNVGQAYLTPIEYELVKIGGFVPVYKSVGIWAKLVKDKTAILGLEHTDQPTIVPLGAVLALGISGEPYFMKHEKFLHLYHGDLY